MSSLAPSFDPITAISYIGRTVLVELCWDDDNEMLWRCYHVIGVVLPVPGVFEDGYFLTVPFGGSDDFPVEIYFDSINTIRAIRDRSAASKVLGSLPLPHLIQSQVGPKEGERRHA
ncbi:hypothetical protein LPB260_23530 [Pseudomonas sp. LPB0260]|uniref:hypothetical protein n=1 Tax=Pseudomonas sp. LPB0260 TaxID=2614442 RepID=UPI0015C1ED7D|nr:hypothetical protein [Pseudomonas sp. LPB0260]QLC73697.1 hypothetical protein LPB260_08580 [Pseudomonas sp. LPB0260]QLC76471.1 hypothetical protein LPB260_23530 [Pseudomonas sp. LPB0260]